MSNETSKKWRKNNPEKVRYGKRRYYLKNKEQIRATQKIYFYERRKKLFKEVLNHYGSSCFVCGRTEKLGVDHIGGWNGDGKYRLGVKLWSWLKRSGFPIGFRILCNSCNTVDGFLRKYRPLGISGIDDLKKLKEGGL